MVPEGLRKLRQKRGGDQRDRERRRRERRKQPVKMEAVVYALSPFQQKIMTGLWEDLPNKIHHNISENWISATVLAPLVGTYTVLIENERELQATSQVMGIRHQSELPKRGKRSTEESLSRLR
ncbi:uncharacterized protein LOC120296400 [Eucalyptus grandis]|uniref:uncharacterized protein LOC120296400 n=1 Tax=Eucalyptus grandis TaxID=71139 RepID=UPI00192E9290|nr:uncharacterized protein LOC120296400 [Eucalyptus grandis]